MANYRAVANGNWSNLATWQDDSLGYFTNSTVLPTSADNVYSNNFTVTIDGVRNANLIANTAFSPPTNLASMSIPQMGSDTTPSGVASANSSFNGPPWQAFDRNTGTFWQAGGPNTGWLSYQFPTGKIIKRYGIFTTVNNNSRPASWDFQGSNDGSSWTTIDSRSLVLALNAFTSFDISSNVTSYLYYRINVLSTGGVNNNVQIASLEMSEITDLYTGTTAGGGFTFANGGDLTCSASNGVINRDVGSVYALTFDLPSPSSATLRASTSTAGAIANGRNILVQNTGTFNMVGNYDIQAAGFTNRATIFINGSTTINIIGNITNSSNISAQIASTLWANAGTPTINITGNVTGGSPNTFTAGNGNGIYSTVATTINITGNVNTNLAPSIWVIGGTLNVTGNITGGTAFPAIANATTAATILATGITTAGTGAPAIYSFFALGSGYGSGTFVRVSGNVVNSTNNIAIVAPRVTVDTNTSSWLFGISTGGNRTLYAPGVPLGNPETGSVRFGTAYGASNELTGSMRVPSSSNVLQGVEVDNTTGTLLMTPADFWNYLIASGFTANSIGDRLQNASTVATTGGQIANYNI